MALLVNGHGRPLTKAQVVAFYSELVSRAGVSGLRITGHSARVTGAQRMAAAGLPLAVIQLFGRWGSNAVLGYVRDSLLAPRGGDISRQVESAALALDEADVRARLHAHGGSLTSAHVDEAAERAFTRLVPQLLSKELEPFRLQESLLALLSQQVEQVTSDLAGVAGCSTPDFVLRLDSELARVHATAGSEVTQCGWRWARGGASPVPSSAWGSADKRCRKCAKRMGSWA